MSKTVMWTLVILGLLVVVGFATWRWAVSSGSAATLDWVDARFSRANDIELAAGGSYGDHPAQRAELWLPESDRDKRPLVVFLHGGGWHSGAPEDYRFVARTLGDRGYAVALVGYRLVPEGKFPAMLEDSAQAVRWARKQAGAAGANADSLVLVGHSAGAYNALMLGLDPRWLAAAEVPDTSIAGVVSMAGPADFYPFTSDSARNALGHIADGPSTQPIHYARGDAPPLLLMHGTADTVVRPYNSQRLAKAIEAAGGEAELSEFDEMSHAGIIMGLSRPFSQGGRVLGPLLDFLETVSSRGSAVGVTSSVPVQRESG